MEFPDTDTVAAEIYNTSPIVMPLATTQRSQNYHHQKIDSHHNSSCVSIHTDIHHAKLPFGTPAKRLFLW